MSDFDPYHKWLGIPETERPISKYRLLALVDFEIDREVISAAAEQRTVYLRTMQAGEHAVLVAQLLNEVSQARVCLLDGKSKSRYDRQLRSDLEPAPEKDPLAFAPEELAAVVSKPATRSRGGKLFWKEPWDIPATAGGIVVLLLLMWLFSSGGDKSLPAGKQQGTSAAEVDPKPQVSSPAASRKGEVEISEEVATILRENNWPDGISVLANCDHGLIRQAAVNELLPQESAESAIEAGHLWWNCASDVSIEFADVLKKRAVAWYHYGQSIASKATVVPENVHERMGQYAALVKQLDSRHDFLLALSFDKSSLSEKDGSLKQVDGSLLHNRVTTNTMNFVAGVHSEGLKFDGNGSLVIIHDFYKHVTNNLPGITVGCFLKVNKGGIIFDAGADSARLVLYSHRFDLGLAENSQPSVEFPPTDSWWFLTATWDGSHERFFVNGEVKKEIPNGRAPPLVSRYIRNDIGTSFYLGQQAKGYHRAGRGFGGVLDEFFVLKRALNDVEIKDLYERMTNGQSLSAVFDIPSARNID
jgi:hypothetical protein